MELEPDDEPPLDGLPPVVDCPALPPPFTPAPPPVPEVVEGWGSEGVLQPNATQGAARKSRADRESATSEPLLEPPRTGHHLER